MIEEEWDVSMASLGMYIYKDENCTEYDNISSGNNN